MSKHMGLRTRTAMANSHHGLPKCQIERAMVLVQLRVGGHGCCGRLMIFEVLRRVRIA